MLNQLRAWFALPVFADEEKAYKARVLNTIMLASFALAIAVAFILVVLHPGDQITPAVIGLWTLLNLIPLALMRRGDIRLAAILFCSILWVMITLADIVTGELVSPIFFGHVIVVLVASLLLGGSVGMGFAMLSLLVGLGSLQTDVQSPFPQLALFSMPVNVEIGTLAIFLMASIIVHLTTNNISAARARSRQQELALSKTNQELQVIRSALEERVVDLERAEASLRQARDELERRVEERTTALRSSEAELRALLAAIPEVILVVDAQGRYLRIAPTNPSLLYRPADQVIGKTVRETFPPELASEFMSSLQRAVETQGLVNTEYALEIDGALTWFNASISPLPDGTLLLVARDITERKQTEQQILRRNEELAALNEIGQILSQLADPSQILEKVRMTLGRVIDSRNLYIALYDEAKQFITFPIYAYNGPRDTPVTGRPFGKGLVEYVIRTRSPLLIRDHMAEAIAERGIEFRGTMFRCYLGVPMVAGEKVLGVIAVQDYEKEQVFDKGDMELLSTVASQAAIALENARLFADLGTRARELEEAYEALRDNQQKLLISEKMASLGRLTAGIAHEMNTPLAAARAALTELEKLTDEYATSIDDASVTPADHREIAKDMGRSIQLAHRAAERAASFVRSIKFQTRDLMPSEHQRFDAATTIQDALLLLSYDLRKTGCTICCEAPDDHIELFGSPAKMGQVVTNLVINAIDASTVKGGGPITVRLARADDGVTLQVVDQGCGIPPENLSKIFDPMFTTKPLGRGTGLGLSIVHDIIAGEFGGTIQVNSQVGEGTTFTIHFPR